MNTRKQLLAGLLCIGLTSSCALQADPLTTLLYSGLKTTPKIAESTTGPSVWDIIGKTSLGLLFVLAIVHEMTKEEETIDMRGVKKIKLIR